MIQIKIQVKKIKFMKTKKKMKKIKVRIINKKKI